MMIRDLGNVLVIEDLVLLFSPTKTLVISCAPQLEFLPHTKISAVMQKVIQIFPIRMGKLLTMQWSWRWVLRSMVYCSTTHMGFFSWEPLL